MSGTYLVQMPKAEARHLAGEGPPWPATPEARCVAAIREWLSGITRSRRAAVPVTRIKADLTRILGTVPVSTVPSRGPFGPGQPGPTLPGRVEYLGDGIVRLDETAIGSLAQLPPGEDFRASFTDAGPVLAVSADTYLAREEDPDPASAKGRSG